MASQTQERFNKMVERVSINGAQLAYRLVGPENAPLIITLHGGRGFGEFPGLFFGKEFLDR